MEKYLLEMFAVSLIMTLLVEIPISRVMGLRGNKHLLLLVLVNVLTNPAAVLLHWLGVPQIPIELGVIALESAVYFWFSRDEGWRIPHPVWLSVAANTASWFLGLLIQYTGGLL